MVLVCCLRGLLLQRLSRGLIVYIERACSIRIDGRHGQLSRPNLSSGEELLYFLTERVQQSPWLTGLQYVFALVFPVALLKPTGHPIPSPRVA